MTIESLEDARNRRKLESEDAGPHMTGEVLCMHCAHTWEGVAPTGTVGLQCPVCHIYKGVFVNPAVRENEQHWHCRCGSEVFSITPRRVYCPNCGLDHKPWG